MSELTGTYTEDERTLSHIKDGNRLYVKKMFEYYRKTFKNYITDFIKKRGITPLTEDIDDIYTESFTIFYVNIREEKLVLPLRSSLQTYLNGVGKKLALRHISRAYKRKELFEDTLDEREADAEMNTFIDVMWKVELVKNLLNTIEERCQQLLRLIFILEFAHEAVMHEMNFPSLEAVRKKKFDCIRVIRKKIQASDAFNF